MSCQEHSFVVVGWGNTPWGTFAWGEGTTAPVLAVPSNPTGSNFWRETVGIQRLAKVDSSMWNELKGRLRALVPEGHDWWST